MTEKRQPRGRPEKFRPRSQTLSSLKPGCLLLLAATVDAGAQIPASPVHAVVDVPEAGARSVLAGAAPRDVRRVRGNFVQGATYRGRIHLTGDAAAAATISVVWGKSAVAARRPVSLARVKKKVSENPFSFKIEECGPTRTEIAGMDGGSFHVGAVSLMPARQQAPPSSGDCCQLRVN